jgi:hypothetical protein
VGPPGWLLLLLLLPVLLLLLLLLLRSGQPLTLPNQKLNDACPAGVCLLASAAPCALVPAAASQ